MGRRRRSENGVDVLILVLCSGKVLLIVNLDPSPDSSLPWVEKHGTPDTSMHHKEGKCVRVCVYIDKAERVRREGVLIEWVQEAVNCWLTAMLFGMKWITLASRLSLVTAVPLWEPQYIPRSWIHLRTFTVMWHHLIQKEKWNGSSLCPFTTELHYSCYDYLLEVSPSWCVHTAGTRTDYSYWNTFLGGVILLLLQGRV